MICIERNKTLNLPTLYSIIHSFNLSCFIAIVEQEKWNQNIIITDIIFTFLILQKLLSSSIHLKKELSFQIPYRLRVKNRSNYYYQCNYYSRGLFTGIPSVIGCLANYINMFVLGWNNVENRRTKKYKIHKFESKKINVDNIQSGQRWPYIDHNL